MSRFEEGCVFLLGAVLLLALFASTKEAYAVTENRSHAQIVPKEANNAIDKNVKTINDSDCLPQDGTDSDNETEFNNDELETVLLNPEQFKKKYRTLKKKMKKISLFGWLTIYVHRKEIFQDSYKLITNTSPEELHRRWTMVTFSSEKGVDVGGLTREWYSLLSEEMFSPSRRLFKYVDENNNNYTLQINPRSGEDNTRPDEDNTRPEEDSTRPEEDTTRSGEKNINHLEQFKFVGKVMGLAIFHGKRINVALIKPFYKMILKKEIDIEDIKSFDPQLYKSLMWTKKNPEKSHLYFSTGDETSNVDEEIRVTKDNVDDYISSFIDRTYVSSVKEQMSAFIEGLEHIVPLHLLTDFDEYELEILFCGPRKIDVTEWKKYTKYSGDYKKNPKIIEWFWEVIDEFNNNQRKKVLQFVTGSDTVPVGGFKNWKYIPFRIVINGASYDVPSANTCTKKLFLPPYETKERLKKELTEITEMEFVKFNEL